MVTLAGGMESDFSDSDCDIVFSTGKVAPLNDKTNDNSDSMPETKKTDLITETKKEDTISETKNVSNGIISNSVTAEKKEHTVRMTPRYLQNTRNRNNFAGRQCLDVQSSLILDDLRYAIMQGNLDAVKDILSKDIYVDTILKAGWSGLMYACSAGHAEIVAFLLEEKANPNYHRDMFTPLMAVCISKKNEDDLMKCCSLLLQHGAKVNQHERHYTTPLMFAAREGHLQIVKELLDHEADSNMQDNRGYTALAWAASSGHGQIIRLLIEKGADVNILNTMGQTPVDLAYEHGSNELVSLFQNSNILKNSLSAKQITDSLTKDCMSGKQISRTVGSSSRDSKKYTKLGELELFLIGVGLQELVPIFIEHQLTFHDLLIMDDTELEKIGITQLGVRKNILEACKAVHKKEWEASSLPNLKQKICISCPEAVAMMANIAKHLKYISSSVIYIRQQIQSQPRILELSQDSANVHDLLDEMEDSLKNVRFLNDELRFLKMHLEKVQDKVQYIPADLIVETVPKDNAQGKILHTAIGITIVSAVFVGIIWKYPEAFNRFQSTVQIRIPFLT